MGIKEELNNKLITMKRYKVGDTFIFNGNDVTVTDVYDNGYLVTYEHEGSKYITRVLIGREQEPSKEHEVIKRAGGNNYGSNR